MSGDRHIAIAFPPAAPLQLATVLPARAWPWLALAGLGLALFYRDALVSLGTAWQRPEYSYGPVVPVIAGLLLLRELHRNPPAPDAGHRLPGLLLVAAGMLAGLAGNLARITDIATYGFILTLGGLVLTMTGIHSCRRFFGLWMLLFFMLPLPQFLYLHLSTWLQSLSSQLGVAVIDMMGIPVFLDGNTIDLGSYQLQVAEACSGLNYLFPMLSIGWIMGLLYAGPRWHRAVLFLSAIPITILMNAVRIGMIGVLVNRYGISQAEGFLHAFEGWIIFMACTAILYGEARLLQRFAAGGRAAGTVLDLDLGGGGATLAKLPGLRATAPLMATAVMLLAAGVAWQARPNAEPAPVARETLQRFPLLLGGWQGQPLYLDGPTQRVLGADDYINASYVKDMRRVDLLLTYYAAQTSGTGGMHSPEVCLPAGGWEVSQWARRPVAVGSAAPKSISVNRAVIRKGFDRQLVYYWFEQRGRETPSDYAAKFMTLRDAIVTGRSDGGLVRLVTPIGRDEDEAAADARLASFMQTAVPKLPDYFPPS